MEVLNIETEIEKWNLTKDKFIAPIKEGEKAGFIIGRKISDIRDCIISADIHITTQDTNFILDLYIKSEIKFTTTTIPTSAEIFDLYKQSRIKWTNEILQRGIKEGYSKPLIIIDLNGQSFAALKPWIDSAILQSLDLNN